MLFIEVLYISALIIMKHEKIKTSSIWDYHIQRIIHRIIT